jgi:hypothetical protein
MDTLFSGRSIWTMIHGIVLGGGALMALAAALFSLRAMRTANNALVDERPARHLTWLTMFTAAALWLTVLVGTYISFPPYRAAPPDGATDLSAHPRSLLLSSPDTAWLHSFAMEIKEHVPWLAVMLATAVAFVAVRYRSRLLTDARLNRMAATLLAICFALVAAIALLGVLINKVAPLE